MIAGMAMAEAARCGEDVAVSASAAISSSSANVRLAAQVGLQLRGDTANSHGLFQTLGHRTLKVAPTVLGSCRLVAADPGLDRVIVRHRA